jgi:PhnB protein
VVDVTEMGGVVAHAVLDFGNGLLQLGEPMPDYGLVAAPEGDQDCYSISLYRPDVDAVVAQADAVDAVVAKRRLRSCPATGSPASGIRSAYGGRS